MIARWDAEVVAAPWAYQGSRPGATPALGVSEFDLGYVLWRVPPPGQPRELGGGTVVVDRHSGELTYWPALPAQAVAEDYRRYRQEFPVSPLTWDPVAQARHERVRAPFPQHVAHLRLASGRLRMARTAKAAGTPNLHPLVREVLDDLPVEDRVRGGERCAEVAVLSDLLHAEATRRSAAGEPALPVDVVRDQLLRGADLVTYQVREPGDPRDGQPIPPCRSCQALLRRFGFAPEAPAEQR